MSPLLLEAQGSGLVLGHNLYVTPVDRVGHRGFSSGTQVFLPLIVRNSHLVEALSCPINLPATCYYLTSTKKCDLKYAALKLWLIFLSFSSFSCCHLVSIILSQGWSWKRDKNALKRSKPANIVSQSLCWKFSVFALYKTLLHSHPSEICK